MRRSTATKVRSTERYLLVLLLTANVACGGKMIDEAPGTPPEGPTAPGPSTPPIALPSTPPSNPTPNDESTVPTAGAARSFAGTVREACSLTCADRGACGAGGMLSDCINRCVEDATVSACADTAEAFVRCDAYGRREQQPGDRFDCGGLDPVCEPLYCALVRCQGGNVPKSCP